MILADDLKKINRNEKDIAPMKNVYWNQTVVVKVNGLTTDAIPKEE